MKITDKFLADGLNQVQKPQSGKAGGADFARLLEESGLTKSSQSSGTSQVASAASLEGAASVGRIMAASASGAAGQVDRTLGALERFAQALGDPSQSLKQVDGLVNALETEASRLQALSAALPEGHGLKQTADQTAVLAAVEAAKFRRGDYI